MGDLPKWLEVWPRPDTTTIPSDPSTSPPAASNPSDTPDTPSPTTVEHMSPQSERVKSVLHGHPDLPDQRRHLRDELPRDEGKGGGG